MPWEVSVNLLTDRHCIKYMRTPRREQCEGILLHDRCKFAVRTLWLHKNLCALDFVMISLNVPHKDIPHSIIILIQKLYESYKVLCKSDATYAGSNRRRFIHTKSLVTISDRVPRAHLHLSSALASSSLLNTGGFRGSRIRI